jgi:glycerol-3-phosphate dehydrogenase
VALLSRPHSGRSATLGLLATSPFDLLVIGGGITGAGIARDAALRGLRTALVERDDFGSGTSSRSSRLIHGGVRYLEYGHFHLVFEASRERRTLLRIAPHLVRPLRFTWPVYQGARVPGWKLGAGLLLYDALALWRNVARHRRLTASGVLTREPELDPRGLTGGAEYFDAATDDARLTLANVLAAAGSGAVVLNHAAVRSITHDASGHAVGAGVHDLLSGETVSVHASAIVNATGPWTDSVRQLADPLRTPSVRGSKGVHLAVPAQRIGNRGAVTLLSAIDGRVMFVLPAGRLTIIGTTESDEIAGPDEVRATSADIEYLLSSVNAAFPRAQLDRTDVVSAWAGIRPLAASGHPSDAASASREHEIERAPSGMVTVTGGKLTTYRAMAAEVVDTVLADLDRPVVPTTTHLVRLPGRERVAAVDALASSDAQLSERVDPQLPYRFADVVYGVECEQAFTLSDLLMRRTHIAFETRDAGVAVSFRVADIVAPLLDWDPQAKRRAIDDYARDAQRVFGWDDATTPDGSSEAARSSGGG